MSLYTTRQRWTTWIICYGVVGSEVADPILGLSPKEVRLRLCLRYPNPLKDCPPPPTPTLFLTSHLPLADELSVD